MVHDVHHRHETMQNEAYLPPLNPLGARGSPSLFTAIQNLFTPAVSVPLSVIFAFVISIVACSFIGNISNVYYLFIYLYISISVMIGL
jgi:hypothetical protein